jgi:putative sigma-54 modulation protein
MDIIIQSLGFNAGESLESFIREKVNTLKSDTIVRANVTLFQGPASNPENDYCEIRLEVPGNDLFVKRSAAYFEVSVNECVDVLNKQLKKNRDLSVDRRKGNDDIIQDELMAAEAEDDDTEPELEDVVR